METTLRPATALLAGVGLFAFGSTQQNSKQGKGMPTKKHALKSYVSDEEYAAIIAKADMTGLSVPTFVKRVSLGHQIVSREDRQARRELLRINADIGRLGGLLKMWLTNEDDFEADVRILLKEIEQRQAELKKAVGRI